jgi:tRNA-dihydrouridine synthase
MMIKVKGEKTAVNEMRKHIAWYIKGMPGASRMRDEIMRISSAGNVLELAVRNILKYFQNYLIYDKLFYCNSR